MWIFTLLTPSFPRGPLFSLALVPTVAVTVGKKKRPGVTLKSAEQKAIWLRSWGPVKQPLVLEFETGLRESRRRIWRLERTVEHDQGEILFSLSAVDKNNGKVLDSVTVEIARGSIRMVVRYRFPDSTRTCPHLLDVRRTLAIFVDCLSILGMEREPILENLLLRRTQCVTSPRWRTHNETGHQNQYVSHCSHGASFVASRDTVAFQGFSTKLVCGSVALSRSTPVSGLHLVLQLTDN